MSLAEVMGQHCSVEVKRELPRLLLAAQGSGASSRGQEMQGAGAEEKVQVSPSLWPKAKGQRGS